MQKIGLKIRNKNNKALMKMRALFLASQNCYHIVLTIANQKTKLIFR